MNPRQDVFRDNNSFCHHCSNNFLFAGNGFQTTTTATRSVFFEVFDSKSAEKVVHMSCLLSASEEITWN